jgi:signal transduction histidine kinase
VGVVVLDRAHPTRIDRELAAVVFRLVQELVMNAVKHADTPLVRVEVDADERALRVSVADHGRGFDVARVREAHPGFGLFSVREQAVRLGGELELDSSPGAGTRATVVVPLREPESKAGAA